MSVCSYRLLALFACILLSGCGEAAPEKPISGKVTFQGAPVTQGTVVFSKASTGEVASGDLDTEGRFAFTNLTRPLTPGEYQVTISPLSVRDPSRDSPQEGEVYVEKGGESIPMRYRKLTKTPLRATIPSDSYDFDMVP